MRSFLQASFLPLLLGVTLLGVGHGQTASFVGELRDDTVWQDDIVVKGDVRVVDGARLTIRSGTTIHMTNRTKLVAETGSTIEADGTADQPVRFIPLNPDPHWWTVKAIGTEANLILRRTVIREGKVRLDDHADALLEDCRLHGFRLPSTISSADAGTITLRRVHVRDYFDIHFVRSRVVVEHSLFEGLDLEDSDALELTQARPGTRIRDTTFRGVRGGNSDAIDLNGGRDVVIKRCRILDVTDKALSIGAQSTPTGLSPADAIVIGDCLIHDAGIGIAVKDGSTLKLHDSTIVQCETGVELSRDFPDAPESAIHPGFNNIVWHHTDPVILDGDATFSADHSMIEGDPFGQNSEPDAPEVVSQAGDDFRLASGSPLLSAGRHGDALGPAYPVGAQTAPSHPSWVGWQMTDDGIQLELYVEPEHDYLIQYTASLKPPRWRDWRTISAPDTPHRLTLNYPSDSAPVYFRIIAHKPNTEN